MRVGVGKKKGMMEKRPSAEENVPINLKGMEEVRRRIGDQNCEKREWKKARPKTEHVRAGKTKT